MSVAETLSDRMKEYESITQAKLIKKQPVIIRLDGRKFSKFTNGVDKPFDKDLSEIFQYVCYQLKQKVDNVKFIYSQSDEISMLLTDWDTTREDNGGRIDTWYDYRIQKMVSIASSEATRLFNVKVDEITSKYFRLYNQRDITSEEQQLYLRKYELWKSKKYMACFDARAFNLPLSEVANYFIFRQKDALRNSKAGFARGFYSQKQLLNVPNDEALEKVRQEKGIDYEDVSTLQKWGFCVLTVENEENKSKTKLDIEIPNFIEDREYIEQYLK